ncbi:MAG: hypothetical protein ACQETB_05680 [Halobacteriota archaeon]
MPGQYSGFDYPALAKRGVMFGVALFVIGALGEIGSRGVYGDLPGWGDALLLSFEVGGILAVLISVFVFGIALPLVE